MKDLSYVKIEPNYAQVVCTCGWKSEPFRRGPFDPAEALVAFGVEHMKCLETPPKIYYAVAKEYDGRMLILTELMQDQDKITGMAKSMAQKFETYHVVRVEVVSSWTE